RVSTRSRSGLGFFARKPASIGSTGAVSTLGAFGDGARKWIGAQLSMISTGTGPLALAGSTVSAFTSTLISGAAELSAWPVMTAVVTGALPRVSASLAVTDHVTFGTLAGMRPYISRSRSSAISARRFGHCAALVTLAPFLKVRISGQSG